MLEGEVCGGEDGEAAVGVAAGGCVGMMIRVGDQRREGAGVGVGLGCVGGVGGEGLVLCVMGLFSR